MTMLRHPFHRALVALALLFVAGTAFAQSARVQIAHLAPFATGSGTSVTVQINGANVLTDVEYGASTGYRNVAPGPTTINIIPTGSTTVAITATTNPLAGGRYTVIATGDGVRQPLALRVLEDGMPMTVPGESLLRLGHLAPFASGAAVNADVRLRDGTPLGEQDGTTLGENVTYGDVSGFVSTSTLPADRNFDFVITAPGGSPILVDPLPLDILPGEVVTILVVGNGVQQPLGVFALQLGTPGRLLPLGTTPPARVQVAHLAPFAPGSGTSVTVRVGSAATLSDVAFGDSTGYIDVPAGPTTINVIPTGSTTVAIAATRELVGGRAYTAIATGDGSRQPLALQVLEDRPPVPRMGEFLLRLGHLAPFASGAAVKADVRLQNGTPLLQNITFGDVTEFLELAAGAYDLVITAPGGSPILIDPLPATFTAGQIRSVFAVGNGLDQPLGAFALPLGTPGSLLPLVGAPQFARVQVAHLAPFAAGAGTSVTVRVDGRDRLTGIEYGDSTAYIDVPAGETTIAVVPTGSDTVAISESTTLEPGQDYTVLAVGDGVRQRLRLIVQKDSLPIAGPGDFLLRLGHLAPFATGRRVNADIRLQDGKPLLKNIAFGDLDAFLPLPAGRYDLVITAPGGSPVLIDPAPADFAAGQMVSAFATGNGVQQPLATFALPAGSAGRFLTPDPAFADDFESALLQPPER